MSRGVPEARGDEAELYARLHQALERVVRARVGGPPPASRTPARSHGSSCCDASRCAQSGS